MVTSDYMAGYRAAVLENMRFRVRKRASRVDCVNIVAEVMGMDPDFMLGRIRGGARDNQTVIARTCLAAILMDWALMSTPELGEYLSPGAKTDAHNTYIRSMKRWEKMLQAYNRFALACDAEARMRFVNGGGQ